MELAALFELDDEAFRRRFRNTPLWRTKRRGILRNAAIVLGNQRAMGAVAVLVRGLADEEALVRGACAWALGEIGGEEARGTLEERLSVETEAVVIEEIELAPAESRGMGIANRREKECKRDLARRLSYD